MNKLSPRAKIGDTVIMKKYYIRCRPEEAEIYDDQGTPLKLIATEFKDTTPVASDSLSSKT